MPTTGTLTHRQAETIDDLRRAVDLLSRAWRAGSPLVAATPAAIEWWHVVGHPDPLGDHLRLWFEGDRPVAWTWHEDGELEWHVWSGDPLRDRTVFRTIVETALDEAGAASLGVFTADDDETGRAVLSALGFLAEGRRLSQWQLGGPDITPRAATDRGLPAGYRVRGLSGPDEFEARVALHRAAFPTSRLTREKYERILTVPHYRLEDDLVVEAPDGSLAAFALTWWDPDGRVGEFEPLGTHPAHQRLGLARALIAEGLRRFRERGARIVQVYSETNAEPAEALYAASGFHRRAFHQRYEHPGAAPTEGPAPALPSTT
jgi:ribosomal protein S18 acetylase RimI-like enzyme